MSGPKPSGSRRPVKPASRGREVAAGDGVGLRRQALDVLQQVLRRGAPLDEVLERALAASAEGDGRDGSWLHHVVVTTLRRLGQIDDAVGACLDHPLPADASLVQDILRLGAAQLLFTRIPDHAAVAASVALCDRPEARWATGLVNAVLRRLAREGKQRLAEQDEPRLNTPSWLWAAWSAAYGEATARAIATAHLDPPPLDLTLRVDGAADEVLFAELRAAIDPEVRLMRLPQGSLRLRGLEGGPARLPGYAEGRFWVQDAAAALPAWLIGAGPGMRIADLCAAPGGKTAQLAAAGATVVSVERSEARAGRLRANLERLGLAAQVETSDVATFAATPAHKHGFDAVLLDAPCSATGTIRRHPDVAWHKSPADVAALATTQARLLDAASALVKPGGRLVYAVCSLQPEEGEAQASRFLAAHQDFIREPVAAEEIGGAAVFVSAMGDLRTLPCHWAEEGGVDGFYALRLRRLVN